MKNILIAAALLLTGATYAQVTINQESNIADADKEKIFEPKFTTKTSGSGLGLAMVKNIVLSYNGSISFTSQVGKGSEFVITLVHFLNK